MLRDKSLEITFLGGCDNYENSCYYVKTPSSNILLDCGDFGFDQDTRYNKRIDLTDIDSIILSHAHLDHSNLISTFLLENDFDGLIISTKATHDLISLDLKRRRGGHFQGTIPTGQQRRILTNFRHQSKLIEYYQPISIDSTTDVALLPAGHMLGSSQILLMHNNFQLLYTGDISPAGTLFLPGFSVNSIKQRLKEVEIQFAPDFTIIESTRVLSQDDENFRDNLSNSFHQNIQNGLINAGNILITCRPKERAQEILYLVRLIAYKYKIVPIEIVLLGSIHETTKVYLEYLEQLNDKIIKEIYQNMLNYPITDQKDALKIVFGGDPQTQRETYANGSMRIFLIPDTFITNTQTIELLILLKNDSRNQLILTGYSPQDTNAEILLSAYNQINNRRGLYLVDDKLRILDSSLSERGVNEQDKFQFRLKIKKISDFPSHGGGKELIKFVTDLIKQNCLNYAIVHGTYKARNEFKYQINKKFPTVQLHLPKQGSTLNMDVKRWI